ncbi:hypothetical protein BH11MYX4_BH11MYX4_08060 [soil metagenome]
MNAKSLSILALAVGVAGCARPARPFEPPRAAVTEPVFDTIGEFRRGERIACAEGTDLVYVVSVDGGLHSFDPGDLRFRRIGTLDCPGTRRSHPHSMAVDRSGQAWVGYDNGVLALARISDASCTLSKVDVRSASLGRRFGMGFAPTPQGGIGGETLFLTTEPERVLADSRVVRGTSLLARIDDGMNITIAGRFPDTLRGLKGELSSRSDGKLFAFFTGEPFELAEIDPATADVRWQKSLEGMHFSQPGSGSWAFAAVGSEFFFFWANQDEPSTVTRLREDGTIEHVMRDAGIQIVGAGASTCATRKPKKEAASAEAPAAGETPKAEAPPPVDPPKPPPAKVAPTPFSKLPPLPPPNPKVAPQKRRPPEAKPRRPQAR